MTIRSKLIRYHLVSHANYGKKGNNYYSEDTKNPRAYVEINPQSNYKQKGAGKHEPDGADMGLCK